MSAVADKHQYYVRFDVKKPDRDDPYYEFELSVCREGTNGDKGWGWASDSKIILLEGDNDTYSAKTVEFITKIAGMICRVLNKREE